MGRRKKKKKKRMMTVFPQLQGRTKGKVVFFFKAIMIHKIKKEGKETVNRR